MGRSSAGAVTGEGGGGGGHPTDRRRPRRRQIISDYVPKAARGPTRLAMLALTAATTVGLFRLNARGEGITRTVKSLWKAIN